MRERAGSRATPAGPAPCLWRRARLSAWAAQDLSLCFCRWALLGPLAYLHLCDPGRATMSAWAADGSGATAMPKETMMLDHVGFAVSDYDRSKAFYEHALAPLGLTLIAEPAGQAAGFGTAGKPWFWVEAQ